MKLKSLMLTGLMACLLAVSSSVWSATIDGFSLNADANPLNTGDIYINQSGAGNAEHQNGNIVLTPGQSHLFDNVVDLRASVFGLPTNGSGNGSFTIDSQVWDSWSSIYVGLKQGNAYAIFELTDQIVSGTWSSTCGRKLCFTLSHYLAFGGEARVPPNPVPVPAAVWLFGSAFAGLFGINRKKTA